jgi:outer membrane protein OmpA-like peptidoglycan-associated protein
MRAAGTVATVAGITVLGLSLLVVNNRISAAATRLERGIVAEAKPKVAIANDAEAKYCTPEFKKVLAKVIHACGLSSEGTRRGCKPADVKSLASISDEDFNALFTPLKQRGAVLMFPDASEKLDDDAAALLDKSYDRRKGARYFFVVARASKTGGAEFNRKLSHKRANSVLFHLSDKTGDPDIDKKVGLLWLGNEFAQLGKEYCEWTVSRPKNCKEDAINRSAFVSWVDCQL